MAATSDDATGVPPAPGRQAAGGVAETDGRRGTARSTGSDGNRSTGTGDRRSSRAVPQQPDGRTGPGARTAGGRPRGAGGPGRLARLPLAASVNAGWAALVSAAPVLLLVVLAHVLDGTGAPLGRQLRIGLAGWLLIHGVPLQTGIGPVRLIPLTLTALAAWRVVRAGVHTCRAIGGRRSRSLLSALCAACGVGAAYGLLGAVGARLASGSGLVVPPGRAGLTLAGCGLVASLAGALGETGSFARLVRGTPAVVRDALRSGTVATLVLIAAGAAAAGIAVALAGGEASDLLVHYRTGVAGQAALTLLCLVFAPNLAIWASAYLVGPGFAVGVGTVVSPARVSLGELPAVPAFAGLPSGPLPWWGGLLLGAPVLAGGVAGWLLANRRLRGVAGTATGPAMQLSAAARSGRGGAGWAALLLTAAAAGPVAGSLIAVAALLSGGSLGSARLVELGPQPSPLFVIGAGAVAAGAVAGAAATKLLVRIRTPAATG
jgi:hypothetical protein